MWNRPRSATGRSRAGKKVDVVVVVAPLEIVAPLRGAVPRGRAESRAGDDFVAGRAESGARAGLTVLAKLTGRVLTVLVREKAR